MPTLLVLAWDVGHNPLGRAHLLAQALARSYRVTLAGFQFPRYGNAVWKPLRDSDLRIASIPGSAFPSFQRTLEDLAHRVDPDVVIACKARLPSVQAGLMIKAVRNRPLIIDIDDYELAFFENREPLVDPDETDEKALKEPFEEAWTRYTENLLTAADRLLVSNAELQRRFGGVVVPHARDETAFRPNQFDRPSVLRRLGLKPDQKVILFAGTPRPHKGLLHVLDAVKRVRRRHDCRLVVVGTPPDRAFEDELRRRGGRALSMIPDQPFQRLPEILTAADLVCAVQDPNSMVSEYQLPAKIVDAMAMEVPVIATDVPPLRNLIEAGAVEPVTLNNLAARIASWLSASAQGRSPQVERARALFQQQYSYRAINRTLVGVVERCLSAPKPLPGPIVDFLGAQARRYPS
ncbi:MAG: glycosyltransferase family 4 protein [Gammaproteobacteria bacterium]|nr:glycosyltransferase family 4 protein [Gammaproteobacteria bacterium]